MLPHVSFIVPHSAFAQLENNVNEIVYEPNNTLAEVSDIASVIEMVNSKNYLTLDDGIKRLMIAKTTDNYDADALVHLASIQPFVEIGVRNKLEEMASLLHFPCSVNIKVTDKPDGGKIIYQHVTYEHSTDNYAGILHVEKSIKPLIDVYCQIDTTGNSHYLHDLDIKLALEFNEDINFELKELFNPYDILRNIWSNIINLYEIKEDDRDSLDLVPKELEFIYPTDDDLDWDYEIERQGVAAY